MSQYKCPYCFSDRVTIVASARTRDVVVVRCLDCGRTSELDTENFVQPGETSGEPDTSQAAPPLAVLAVEEDLVFRSKLEAAASALGRSLVLASGADALVRARSGGPWARVLVALDPQAGDQVALIEALRRANPTLSIVAYGSHVARQLHERARLAGASLVLPRSALVQRLKEVLGAGPDGSSRGAA